MFKAAVFLISISIVPAVTFGQSADPAATAQPEDTITGSHYLKAFGGTSLLLLGTQDRRTMYGVEYGYGHPDKRLAFRRYPAQLVSELKVDYSRASGNFPQYRSSDLALGAIFYAHYEMPWEGSRAFYVDWGGGAESFNHTSKDLPLSFNGAILVGFGYVLPQGNNHLLVGLRYFHISNAGRKRPNYGQNQLQLTVGLRF